MPRGRKGSPQENVDSILLAMSRRHNLDPETMSHYFDRLDDEWSKGAREKVLHLLRSSDPAAHTAAIMILSELAEERDLDDLEEFVTDPTASDMAKLALSPVLRDLGSELADDGMIEYLNDPSAAIQQMQSRLLELVGQSEIGVESILQDVVSMPSERRQAFISWLGGSNDPRAANLLIPLLENLPGKEVGAVLEALEQLGPVAVRQTIPALNHIIATHSNREVKQSARAVLGRLTMQSMIGAEEAAMARSQQRLPEFEARCSFIDGSGSQLIMLSWQRPDGSLKGVNVLFQDQWGIKECYGIDEVTTDHWGRLVRELYEQGLGSFLVSFDYARALLADARAMNRRFRHKLPIAYAIWRPFVEQEDGVKKAASALTVADRVALDEKTRELAYRGYDLYRLPEFASWLYEPVGQLEPYISRYWANYSLSESRQSSRRKSSRQQEQQHVLLEQLVEDALEDIMDDRWRATYEVRLRRQAALFRLLRREQDAALACAVAAMLRPDSQVASQDQPFLRAMMRISIEQGPLRLMMEALGDKPEAMPIVDIFDRK